MSECLSGKVKYIKQGVNYVSNDVSNVHISRKWDNYKDVREYSSH